MQLLTAVCYFLLLVPNLQGELPGLGQHGDEPDGALVSGSKMRFMV